MAPEPAVAEPTREAPRPAVADVSDKQSGQVQPASPLAQSLTRVVGNPTPVKGPEDMGLLDKVRWVEDLISSPLLDTLVSVIEDPASAVASIKGVLSAHLAAAPEKIREQLVAAGLSERNPHFDEIWTQIKARLAYMWEHWWEVVKTALVETLFPIVSLYHHVPEMVRELRDGWHSLRLGHYGEVIDHLLDLARAIYAVISGMATNASLALFIVGSILGTPLVGEGVLVSAGMIVMSVDAALQLAVITKGLYDISPPGLPPERITQLAGRIADSVVSLGMMLSLLLIGSAAGVAARALVTRFGVLNNLAESAMTRVRGALGIEPGRAPVPHPSELPAQRAIVGTPAPQESRFPVRQQLTPQEQVLFDRWVQTRRTRQAAASKGKPGKSPTEIEDGLDRALGGKSPEQVRKMIESERGPEDVREQARQKIDEMYAHGDTLDPKTTHGPIRSPDSDVWVRFDERPPSYREVVEAKRLSRHTGERVDLFGDDWEGIDGTIGHPPRPLQLKYVPEGQPSAEVLRVTGKAVEQAAKAHYTRVEVSVDAPGLTVKQVEQEFLTAKSRATGEAGVDIHAPVTRVRVWCKDGVYEPTRTSDVVVPTVHVDLPDRRDDNTAP